VRAFVLDSLLRFPPSISLSRIFGRFYAAAARLFIPGLSACFDPSYYRVRYPDVERSGIDPLAHFLLFGGREGRQPDAVFDVQYYLANNPDVAVAGANPLIHFLRSGWKEGRRPNPLFDAGFYAQNHTLEGNPYVDYVVRRRRGERPKGWVSFALSWQSYQVATQQTVENKAKATIDVIVPVYSGLAETRACLESLLAGKCRTAHQVVLINDQSPDPTLGGYLREMAEAHGWVLLENSGNLGFAGSVNRGLELHPDRDVVLLNNDTKVANDWLDRLAAAAYAGRTGTVTPFSNQATICSYAMREGDSVEELDRIFRQVNARQRIHIPTGVGFCMYIRRECLNEVGGFRADLFGKGYGEENDFCLRALYKGWDNVLATDVFVYHAGETSFGSEAEERRNRAVQTLQRLHPDYGRRIANHERRDPAQPYRVAVSGWRLRQSGRPVILSITHNLGGGIEQYVHELRESIAGEAEMLLLTPTECGMVVLRSNDFQVTFEVESEYERLVELLRYCGVSRIHVQHLQGHSLDVVRLRSDLAGCLDFSLHDYFTICPQVTLTDASGRYCGEPDPSGCKTCLTGRPPWPRLDIDAWRKKYGALVRGADRVIAPSLEAADRIKRYFPEARVMAALHPGGGAGNPVPAPVKSRETLVIAVLGTLTQPKGAGRLREAAREADRRKLPLRFVLVGQTLPPAADEPFSKTGPYNRGELPRLLRESGAHVVWFPAQWPETFSYTLSECLALGMPVVAPDLGAFPERLAGRNWSWVVPWNWDISRMLDFFIALQRDHFQTGRPPEVPGDHGRTVERDFYPLRYLRLPPRS
jgi:GT2 family glycosyltransferase/glycosyltransferase involved in cell wall biosynthesis